MTLGYQTPRWNSTPKLKATGKAAPKPKIAASTPEEALALMKQMAMVESRKVPSSKVAGYRPMSKEAMQSRNSKPLDPRSNRAKVMAYLETVESAHVSEIAEKVGITRKQVGCGLSEMKKRGRVKSLGLVSGKRSSGAIWQFVREDL